MIPLAHRSKIAIFTIWLVYVPMALGASHYDAGLIQYSQGHYQAALQEFYAAAKQGEPGASHMLMRMHAEGHAATRDEGEAFRWMLAAAQEGIADAQFKAGLVYLQKKDSIANALPSALHWFSKAAEQGHIAAHYELAQMYQHGIGVDEDKIKAAALFRFAASEYDIFAQKGDAGAQNSLGEMYENGLGMPVSLAMAIKWYQRAAVQGSADGQFNIGRVLAKADQEQLNPEEVLYWLGKAAQQGHREATRLRAELEKRWPDVARR